MGAYFKFEKLLFKSPEIIDGKKLNQTEIIDEMAFKESDTADQLNEKNK